MASKPWQILRPVIDVVVFSNTWISLGTLSLYLSVCLAIGISPITYEALLVFCSSFIAYNLLKLKGLKESSNTSIFHMWLRDHRILVYVLMFLASIALLYALIHISFAQCVVLALSVSFSVIYIGFERFNLRAFWFLKTQIVALVWTLFIMGIALINIYQHIPPVKLALLSAGIFFFILGLTIPFDIRDWEADKLDPKITTLPMVFGLRGTVVLSIIHLCLAFVSWLLYAYFAIVLLPVFTIAVWRIYRLKSESKEYEYTFLLDGLIVLIYPSLQLLKTLCLM
jgi:hypothetical protein